MMIKMEKNMDLKNKYDSIIFDLDGTLWNSSKPICEAWNIILDRHKEIVREPITIEELGQCMGLPMYDIAAKLFPDEKEEVREGARQYSRAIVTVTDRLFKPSWWSVADTGGADTPLNSVEEYYLGIYLEDKYKMFLDELKKDDMVFDGKNKQVLRKYALKLKNTLKDINAERAAQGLGPLVDEKTQLEITVPVAG